ncbi:MAG TPA: T9SS type A sorting domain-containing protein, partial [Bacteroidota bacterium]|nr:T9SS type A sorting domain-containing protein [Bacteroidota bacterium]
YATSPSTISGVDNKGGAPGVQSFRLEQNYPNPFNPSTTITFDLPRAGFTTLKVYDVLGNEVRTLLSGELPAGVHQSRFDGTGLSSGVYFYRLRSGTFTQTMKLIFTR